MAVDVAVLVLALVVELLNVEAMIKDPDPTYYRDNLSSSSSRKGLIWHQDASKIQP